MKVTFEGTSAEIKKEIYSFLSTDFSFQKIEQDPRQLELVPQNVQDATTTKITPPPQEPKKVGKKHTKVEEVVAAMPTEVKVAVIPTEPGDEAPTKESVLKAMKDLNAAKGIVPVQKILKDFGAARATDVKQNDWAKFIQTCNEAAL